MKHKHFYSHLVQINDIILDLGELDMSPKERVHLLSLLEANIHAAVIHVVLSELQQKEKKVFLENVLLNNHSKIWDHLISNASGLEKKIERSAKEIILKMRQDIKSVKKSK